MGFVNETIDTPERIREFDQLKLISPITRRPAERWRWTVDRERGIYLISVGGGALEIPHIYALIVLNGVVWIEGEREAKENLHRAKYRLLVKWQISQVRMPRALKPQAPQLLSIVSEALTTCGLYHDNERVKSVKVSLPSPTFV